MEAAARASVSVAVLAATAAGGRAEVAMAVKVTRNDLGRLCLLCRENCYTRWNALVDIELRGQCKSIDSKLNGFG